MRGIILLLLPLLSCFTYWAYRNNTIFGLKTENTVPDSLYPSPSLVVSYHTKWAKNHYNERIIYFKKQPLSMYDIVFVGNSIIEQGGDWGMRFGNSNIKNRGISGDVTEGVLNRLGEICYIKPTAVFILFGINDLLAYKSANFVVSNTLKIVKKINLQSHDTKVYIQTILPTDKKDLILKIKDINNQLKNKANANNYSIIDLHNLFAGSNDLIKCDLTYDGTHPNEAGYLKWVNCEKHILDTLINHPTK